MKPLSKAAQVVIKLMHDAELADSADEMELVVSGFECWVGLHRTSARTVLALERRCLIRRSAFEGKTQVYTLNEDGRKAVTDPTWCAPEIAAELERLGLS